MKTITGKEIKLLQDKIHNFPGDDLTPVDAILLYYAEEAVKWAANYCVVGDMYYSGSDLGAEVIAHYQAAQVLSKLAAGIR